MSQPSAQQQQVVVYPDRSMITSEGGSNFPGVMGPQASASRTAVSGIFNVTGGGSQPQAVPIGMPYDAAVPVPVPVEEDAAAAAAAAAEDEFSFDQPKYFLDRQLHLRVKTRLRDIINDPENAITFEFPIERQYIFMKHDPAVPGDMSKRTGNLERTIIREARLAGINSPFPFALLMKIDDRGQGELRGNKYSFTGKRAPYIVMPYETNFTQQTIHRADQRMADLIRNYGHITPEDLEKTVTIPTAQRDRGFVLVPVDSDLASIIRANEELRGILNNNNAQGESGLMEDGVAAAAADSDSGYLRIAKHVVDGIIESARNTLAGIRPFNLSKLRVRFIPDIREEETMEDVAREMFGDDLEDMLDEPMEISAHLGLSYAILEPAED